MKQDASPPPPERAAVGNVDHPAGFAYGISAYGLWGLIPIYFRQLRTVPPLEMLAHRAAWALATLAVIIVVAGRGPSLVAALRNRRTVVTLLGSAALIAVNWLTYIYSVATEQVFQAALGYFITPLANMALGMFVLGERMRKLQWAALVPAVVGVAAMTIQAGQLPWIALLLAVSFSLYGLLRKLAAADALVGLFAETMFLTPIALAYLGYLASAGLATFGGHDARMTWLLALSGPVTTGPLLCFAAAARNLRMTTLGFLQFLAPMLQAMVAVFLFREPFKPEYRTALPLIGLAVALYVADAVQANRRRIRDAAAPMPLEDI
ncbi:MAG: EamA family transporter RarD [Pirellulales bacterium]